MLELPSIERISKIASLLKGLEYSRSMGKDSRVSICESEWVLALDSNEALNKIMIEARGAAISAANAVYAKRVPEERARLEAALRGVILPQPEPGPDAYLAPVIAAFGPHQGLNANWAVMAWPVFGDMVSGVYITDDESPDETVSLVHRIEEDESPKTIMFGPVATILPIAVAFRDANRARKESPCLTLS